jgi:enamine deaminase RidA (YjgF/YER057c/UK114 family)
MVVKGTQLPKRSLHVQSISSWAPANIGPYSQAHKIESKLHIAGTIPLIPDKMVPARSDAASLMLRHTGQIAREFDMDIENCDMAVFYTTEEGREVPESVSAAKVVVSGLPMKVPVEIELHLNSARRACNSGHGSF